MKKSIHQAACNSGRSKHASQPFNRTISRAFSPLAYAIWSALVIVPSTGLAQVQAEQKKDSDLLASFDMDTLKARGIDPKLAEYFREASKFTEGRRVVSLVVNGIKFGLSLIHI